MKLIAWLGQARVEILTPQQVAGFDPRQLAFYNLNTPEEFRQAEELAGAGSG
jgi:molybdopterin-guanine dinucleotide biosynthesis protein A